MVFEDVSADVNGVPHKLPEAFYQRLPLLKTEENTYDDWVRRRATPGRLLSGVEFETDRLRLQVEKLAWEKELRERPLLSSEESECNKHIIDILEGMIYLGRESMLMGRIAREGGQAGESFQSS
jgi:hypothetical protein